MSTYERVKSVIADALYLEADEVTAESRLMQDLGAESIDFLDIMFRLEKEFGISLPKGEAERRARGGMSDEEFAVDGRLSDQALARLKQVMPEVDPAALAPGLMVRDIPSLFTTATFVRMVEEKVVEDSGPVARGVGRAASL